MTHHHIFPHTNTHLPQFAVRFAVLVSCYLYRCHRPGVVSTSLDVLHEWGMGNGHHVRDHVFTCSLVGERMDGRRTTTFTKHGASPTDERTNERTNGAKKVKKSTNRKTVLLTFAFEYCIVMFSIYTFTVSL